MAKDPPRNGINRNPGGVVDSAGITRDQWENFLEFYKPIEDEVLKLAQQTDFTAEGDAAGRTAAAGVNASRGTLSRNLRRSGVSLSAEQRTGVNRRQDLSLARSVGRAENTTRRGLSDSRTNLLAQIVGIGRGVAQTASGGLQSVADMAAQRQVQFDQQKSAQRSTNTNALATAASLAIMFV